MIDVGGGAVEVAATVEVVGETAVVEVTTVAVSVRGSQFVISSPFAGNPEAHPPTAGESELIGRQVGPWMGGRVRSVASPGNVRVS